MVIEAPKVDHQIQIDEFNIQVPWGHIACKWWGSKSIQPIICLHGWQDNAATFDRLIPCLPTHLSYLVVEFPGHGLSSPIPHGMIYSYATFLYVLLFVIKKFNWKRVSLLGHSLGAMVSYTFASTFPDRCEMVISVDLIKPDTLSRKFAIRVFVRNINHIYIADKRNQENSEPPSYTYDDLIKRRHSNKSFPMNIDSVRFLMYRGARPSKSDPNKYYFSCDSRLKEFEIMIPIDVYEDMATRIVAPFCFIKAGQSLFPETEYLRIIGNMQSNPDFEFHRVDGGHHVHLDDPEAVAAIVSKFIEKHRSLDCKL